MIIKSHIEMGQYQDAKHTSSVSRHSFRALTLVQTGAIVVSEQLATSGITRYLKCVYARTRACADVERIR